MKRTKGKKFVYFVEGENEKVLINCIKNRFVVPGVVSVFNPLQKNLKTQIRMHPPNTCVILVFDTDSVEASKIEMLRSNIQALKKSRNIQEVILIPQVKNFEDELVAATSVSKAMEFTNSKSGSDFKRDFNRMEKQLLAKLEEYHFDIRLLWAKNADNDYREFNNTAEKIKLISSKVPRK